ncbi:MAG: ATP-dependent helicase [Verrucomicrobiales bacterium]|nr:UvrD-helicase domain-containing protein [Verrucomicrobiae bacterium]MCP5552589.1 UvrD-helicase domain-containing protein [Akkermansiaceae bacterium]
MKIPRAGLLALNPEQRQAAEQIHGPVLILAGAGTGKTRVITTRIAWMLANDIQARHILAVTFTNKAASEMRERVATMVDQEEAKLLTISTFHSLCVRILRESIEKLGYKKTFSIYTQSDQLGLIKKIIVRKAGKEENLDPKLAQMLISRAKNRGIPVSESEDALIADVFRAYQAELKVLNAVDFDDLLILAVRVLEQSDEARAFWRRRYRYIMVDEFQDTNRLQMDLLRLLVGEDQHICVVGDDDQSIYGWRGAEVANILEFERFFSNPKIVKLEENYRSTNAVLSLANSLIRHNRNRREKTLRSGKGDGEMPRILAMPDAETEADAIADEILTATRIKNRPYEEFAVLFRMNTQSRLLEEAMRRREIPYRIIGGQSFFERREVKDLLAYLSMFLNQDDDVSLLRVINSPPRGIGDATVTAATEFSIEKNISVYEALEDLEFLSLLSSKSQGAVARFTRFVSGYRDSALTDSVNYGAMTEALLKELNYTDHLRKTCKDPEEASQREKNVRELIESMYHHQGRRPEKGLRGFLDSVALMQDREKEDENPAPGVSLITMHAAKGLEFHTVYIVGVEEGVLPHTRSVEEGTRDEERRLLYVGITRAMRQLTITWCRARRRYGEPLPCYPSSFLKEMAPEWMLQEDFEVLAKKPATEEVAKDYFARMREMLGSK